MDTLRNYTNGMNLTGAVADVLTANEKNWVQRMLTDNPGLFAAFYNRQDGRIFKCMWHGEFPGKLLTGADGLYLNWYGASELHTRLADGTRVVLKQETDYPKTGSIRLTVMTDADLALHLRVPSWSENTSVRVCGESLTDITPGTYCRISRAWKTGDVVELGLDMSIHFWVRECGGKACKVSAYRGPVLLAFRTSDDLPSGTVFQMTALREAKPCEGGGLVNLAAVRQDGSTVVLTDYYSAGKDGQPYVSWLTSDSSIGTEPSDRNTRPVWCRR